MVVSPTVGRDDGGGLQEVDTYVSHIQNTVAHFISTRSIMDLCLASERRPGSSAANQ